MGKKFLKGQGKIHIILITFAFCFVSFFYYFKKEIKNIKKKNKSYKTFYKKIDNQIKTSIPLLGNLTIPLSLQNIPLADESKIVLNVKKIKIKNVQSPYNASIIKHGSHYLLFFRYDVIQHKGPYYFYSYIGCVKLDSNFNQIEKNFKIIDLGTKHAEDPRIFKTKNGFYLVYNDLVKNGYNCRTMRIASLDIEKLTINYTTELDIHFQPVEKNWNPFEHIENGKSNIYFEYFINPHKILKLNDPTTNSLTHIQKLSASIYQRLYWPNMWGEIRGGAPAQKIEDNKYLSFFHSSFQDRNGFFWYVMGAYTFETNPPFRINGISHYPILFKGIYDSPHLNIADRRKRVIFPSGFTVEKKENKEVIHVSCGENDSCIKIITLDKKKLLKSLKKL